MSEKQVTCHPYGTPKLVGLVLICLTILGSFFFLSRTGIYVKDASNQELPNNLVTNTISVEGEGKVFVEPDMLTLDINMREESKSTAEAQKAVNKKIAEVKTVFENYKVRQQDVQTVSVSVRPEYDRMKEGGRELRWYVAEQTMRIKIQEIDGKNKDKAALIIDDVTQLEGIQIHNISYDIKDKTPFYTEARKLAMTKAKQKAEELADAGEVNLAKPISINEHQNNYYPPYPMAKAMSNVAYMEMDAAGGAGGSIAGGQLELSISVNVVYGIE